MDFIYEFLKKDYTTYFFKFDFKKENIIHYNVEVENVENVEKYH